MGPRRVSILRHRKIEFAADVPSALAGGPSDDRLAAVGLGRVSIWRHREIEFAADVPGLRVPARCNECGGIGGRAPAMSHCRHGGVVDSNSCTHCLSGNGSSLHSGSTKLPGTMGRPACGSLQDGKACVYPHAVTLRVDNASLPGPIPKSENGGTELGLSFRDP